MGLSLPVVVWRWSVVAIALPYLLMLAITAIAMLFRVRVFGIRRAIVVASVLTFAGFLAALTGCIVDRPIIKDSEMMLFQSRKWDPTISALWRVCYVSIGVQIACVISGIARSCIRDSQIVARLRVGSCATCSHFRRDLAPDAPCGVCGTIPRQFQRCVRCDYPRMGFSAATPCPECGTVPPVFVIDPRCAHCNYSLIGTRSDAPCPECGREQRAE